MFDIVGLLTIPLHSKIEQRRFDSAKLQAASEAVSLAAETRRAWFNAVAAQQSAHYAQQVRASAEASAELAKRMAQVGNVSKLDQLREQAFYADAIVQLAQAQLNATAAREQLSRLMGVWGARTAFSLPERLPALPSTPINIERVEAQAIQRRLDVQMAKLDTEMTASVLGLSKATGFINVLQAGYTNKSETGSPRENGYAIQLELPIFDWGGARNAKAKAIYMQSVERTAHTAIRARSEAREAYAAYRTGFDLARHYRDEVVPLRKSISAEVLLRYNGMLIGALDLLDDAREQISTVNAAIQAERDFWLADSDLQAAISGSALQLRQASSPDAGPAH
jgi:outer membrane protein TolC